MSEVTSTQANKGMKQTSVEHIGRSQLIPVFDGPTEAESKLAVCNRMPAESCHAKIIGAHAIIYSRSAEADRGSFRWCSTDTGGGGGNERFLA